MASVKSRYYSDIFLEGLRKTTKNSAEQTVCWPILKPDTYRIKSYSVTATQYCSIGKDAKSNIGDARKGCTELHNEDLPNLWA